MKSSEVLSNILTVQPAQRDTKFFNPFPFFLYSTKQFGSSQLGAWERLSTVAYRVIVRM
jgi:hypothetical protein